MRVYGAELMMFKQYNFSKKLKKYLTFDNTHL